MPSRVTPPGFKPLASTALFTPITIGSIQLEHRIVQAPTTRFRTPEESPHIYVPGELNVEYYAQRATKGGLQITEATSTGKYNCGYPRAPGVFTDSQVKGWKAVTDAVHAKGGKIVCQIWHVGRATIPAVLDGRTPISSTTTPIAGGHHDGTLYSDVPPRQMTVEEIHEVTQDFVKSARNAIEAGFDGVELHGGNGYLLDQFLHDNVNSRTDSYGGSVENRCRFPLEVIKAVGEAIGGDKVGMRLTPYNYYQDTKDSKPVEHWSYLCEQIVQMPKEYRLSYVSSVEPRFDEVLDEKAKMDALHAYNNLPGGVEAEATVPTRHTLMPFRNILKKGDVKLLAAGNFDRENAVPKVEADEADCVVFGRHYIANPDLVERLAQGLPLNKYDRNTFYGADPPQKGYTDYPFYDAKTDGVAN